MESLHAASINSRVTVGLRPRPYFVCFNHPHARSIRLINERVRARFVVNFPDFNFGRGQPLQGVGHISRPYAPRRVITQLYDVALLVLCDPHQYLPSELWSTTEPHANGGIPQYLRQSDLKLRGTTH